jgi:cytochrome c553
MKAISSAHLAVALALAVLGATTAARAENSQDGAAAPKGFEEKLAYCKTCHGVSGQGFRGAFPMPRLAGQQPEYIENQLKAFIEKRRANPVMGNVAHVLNPDMVKALSQSFHNLDPAPLGGGSKSLEAEGKTIYENGVESANVPACASCHGPEAKGDGQFPRLAGQLNDYVIKKLTNFEKERGQNPAKPDTSQIMAPIAHSLTPEQIAAVASYVAYLK